MPPIRRAALLAACLLAIAASPAAAQTFTPVASPAFAAHVAFSTGVTWVDVDLDGDLDLYVAVGFSANNANVLYRNDGAGGFVAVTGVPLVQDAAETACSAWADADNDGDIDAYVSNLVGQGGMFFRGQGGADLTLETGAGLGGVSHKGTGCAWGDFDADGWVDLVVAALFGQGGIVTGNRLYHNDGDGTFTEIAGGPATSTLDTHHHPTWSDYDGDGDLDLFFASGPIGSTGTDRLYRNRLKEDGAASFEAITTGVIATDPRDSQVLTWADIDDDGDLDLYAINYTSVGNQLYRNDGAAGFTRLTTGAIVTDAGAAHGAVWGDFDNDGDQDVYVVRDLGQNNRYYRNDGAGVFTSVTAGAFVNDGLSNYGGAAGDYDRDGDLDLFVPTARSEAPSVLYRNNLASGSHWLVVSGQGTVSNRSAIGAKVRVHATIGGVPRWQMREIAAGTSYGGHNALEAHFGLGDATVADSIRVEWPSGMVDLMVGVAADARLVVIEGSAPVAVESGPARTAWFQGGAPNPFRARTTLRFALARAGPVLLRVYDTAGRCMATLVDADLPAGAHAAVLDAKELPAAGIYLARLSAGGRETVGRIVLLR